MPIDSMNKVIHAAVRRDLGRLQHALEEVPDGDRTRAAGLTRAWNNLNDQLHHHHQQEDTILFPTLLGLGVDGSLLQSLESEHQAMADALDEIAVAMRTYATSASADDARQAADAVRRGKSVVDAHLAHEEGDLEPLATAHLDTPEWRSAMKQIQRQPPTRAGNFFAWLQDGMAPDVRAYFDSEIPKPVRFVFGRIFGRGYNRAIAPVWR